MENIIISIFDMLFFIVGFYIGKRQAKDNVEVTRKEFKIPELNPMKIYENIQESKKQKESREEFEINMHNIDVYDGTSIGQLDFKR